MYRLNDVRWIVPICFLTLTISSAAQNHKPPSVTLPNSSLIVPGKSVGPLSLGASRNVVERIFPFKKNMDQEDTYTDCGPFTGINWLDFAGESMNGNVFVYLRNDQVFQIATATPRFATMEGIRAGSAPEAVKRAYTDLEAYILHPSGGQMFDFRDFIYWVSGEKGIAFELAYGRKDRSRFVNKVIVFQPHSEFVPEGCIFPPQQWHKVSRYFLGDN